MFGSFSIASIYANSIAKQRINICANIYKRKLFLTAARKCQETGKIKTKIFEALFQALFAFFALAGLLARGGRGLYQWFRSSKKKNMTVNKYDSSGLTIKSLFRHTIPIATLKYSSLKHSALKILLNFISPGTGNSTLVETVQLYSPPFLLMLTGQLHHWKSPRPKLT